MSTPDARPLLTAPRSGLITALAWILIVVGGFTTLIAVMQNVMMFLVFRGENMPKLPPQGLTVPPMAEFMFEYGHWFFAGFLMVSVLGLVSGVGLLRRKYWARLAVIGLLAFGIVWNLGGTVASFFLFKDFMPPEAPPEFAENFDLLFKVMMVVNVAIAVGFAGLFAWLIRRLLSPEIRSEFGEDLAR